jgi:AcrR family transcriptional regulator
VPRAGLNEDRVVDEAETMADEVGLDQLTLAGVAGRLGVRQPSLYKHIDSIAALKRLISLRAKAELAQVLSGATVGRAGGDAVTALARAYRVWALGHPGRYQAAQWAPAAGDVEDETVSAALVGICASVLVGYELVDDDLIDAIRALRSALHGFVLLESGRGFGLPVDVDRSFDRLVEGLVGAIGRWTVPVRPG